MNTDNRVSPQAPEIEEAILGACLIEQEAMPLVADKLRPEMFYVLRHQIIYAAMLAMYQAGTKIDILTVKEELSHRGKLEEAGGLTIDRENTEEQVDFILEKLPGLVQRLRDMSPVYPGKKA